MAKKKEEKKPARAPAASNSKSEWLESYIAQMEKQHGSRVIQRAEETASTFLLRRPTGILSLDIGIAGGFPASAVSVIVGPDGVGKDYLLWCTAAQAQKNYGDQFRMAVYMTESRPDKAYMRDYCGFKVAHSDQELDDLDQTRQAKGFPPLTDEERARYQEQVGDILFIYGVTAEDGFDIIADLVESNTCQIVAVNSIGFLQTEAKEDTESFSEFPQRANEAMLLSKVMPKLAMILNKDTADGGRNETTILFLNQVRSKNEAPRVMPGRMVRDRDKYRPGVESYALKHGKAIEVLIHNGADMYDQVEKTSIGRVKDWKLTKGKLGTHDGVAGTFNYLYATGADVILDLIKTAKSLGVLEGDTWLTYDNDEFSFRAQGEEKARQHIEEHPELIDLLREECFAAAKIVYRTT